MRIPSHHSMTHNAVRAAIIIAVAIALMVFLIRSAAL